MLMRLWRASRLAAANGLPIVVELLMDAEHSMAGFLKGDQETFKTLASLGGVTVDDLMRRAFVPSGISTYRCMGQELGEKNLLRGRSRVCPACFRKDAGPELTHVTALNSYGRVLWALASARLAGKKLVHLVTFAGAFGSNLTDVRNSDFYNRRIHVSAQRWGRLIELIIHSREMCVLTIRIGRCPSLLNLPGLSVRAGGSDAPNVFFV